VVGVEGDKIRLIDALWKDRRGRKEWSYIRVASRSEQRQKANPEANLVGRGSQKTETFEQRYQHYRIEVTG
jgi:hypothetical protein